jgi:hypothetical protein
MAENCGDKGPGSTKFAELPASCSVSCPPFKIDASEGAVFDHFAQEHVSAHGTELKYWHQDLEASRRDALYDEPINRAWRGPFKLTGFVEYMEGQPGMREEGAFVRWEGRIWIARKELEDNNCPAPTEGDVIQYWDDRFFAGFAVNDEHVPGSGYYFDVIKASDDGHVGDTGYFVGFSIQVLRRTEFTPERRLEG